MATHHKSLTIVELINKTTTYFKQKDIENPRLNAERLLSHALNIDRVQLYLQYDRLLSEKEMELFRNYVRRRADQEPLQYIIGEAEFMGLNFKITPAVLIPRPETEMLVEKALLLKDNLKKTNPIIWDIGTGSGCIAVSIAHHWHGSSIIASDISDESLNLARENAETNGVLSRINFVSHNILSDPVDLFLKADIIVSNPPYVSKSEFSMLGDEIRLYEPKIALTDNSDGLNFYKRIFSLIENKLECKFIMLELSGTQTNEILALADKINKAELELIEDLNHIPRILKVRIE
jgi:release factor glutamine methyltransferase